MDRKGIFMPLLAIFTVSLFVYMMFVLGDSEERHIFVGEGVPLIFDSYQDAEINYFNHENIVRYSLDKVLSESFPDLFPKNELESSAFGGGYSIPADIDSFLIVKLQTEIFFYEMPESVNIADNKLIVVFNEIEHKSEFSNGNFNYKINPTITIDIKEIKEKIENARNA